MFELVITPSGQLRCKSAGQSQDGVAVDDLSLAFQTQGTGAGLFHLAVRRNAKGLNPAMLFWRDFASGYLISLCHTPETASVARVEMPTPAEMAQMILSVPPMTGAEYLTMQTLETAWQDLDVWTREKVKACGGLANFLNEHAPHWHQVGRVCFHLAENKDDPEFPFAFLATYASSLDKAGRPRYLPLSQALNQYAGAKNKNALVRLLTPISEAAKKSPLVANMTQSGDIYHPYPLEADEAYQFLTEIPDYEQAGLLVRVPDWWRKRQRVQASVTVGNKSDGKFTAQSLLNFHIDAAIGDETLTRQELEALLASGSGLRFVKGQWVEVDADRLKQVLDHWQKVADQAGDGISLVQGMRLLAGANADLGEHDGDEQVRAWSDITAGSELQALLKHMRSPEQLDAIKPGKRLHATLRPYQQAGLNWLWLLSEMGLGACLADDMGLGKTIQVIALLLMQKKARKDAPPSLIIVPASLLGNWKSEIERFAPSLDCVYLHRSHLSKDELEQHGKNQEKILSNVDVVFTTYAMVTRQEWLRKQDWNLCVIDEAQAIKNPTSNQSKLVKKINARARIAMTGTPVENRLGDLWSLFDFVNPGLLGSSRMFKTFIKGLAQRQTQQYLPLRNLVRPYILRRLKTDRSIINDLPDKTEVKAYCHLTKKQAALYAKNVQEMRSGLDTADGMARRGFVLSYLMRFKQLCNHPSQLTGDTLYDHADSGKFTRLREIGEEIASRQEKVLVFTQFREMTTPLASFLGDVFGQTGLTLHGQTPVKERKKRVDQFQDENGPSFFVLSLKAGGTGLNLTAANHVIHFDRWWNPAVENQATDRAFRIGQKRNVLVHKFVCKGTLEERIDELIAEKSRLAGEILESSEENALTEMSNDDLLKLVSLDIEQAVI